MSRLKSSRGKILDAAEAIVLESGAGHMTLDAVAERAEVSKGGLLYHFPSKEALLKGMLERLLTLLEERQNEKGKRLTEEPGGEIKAFILSRVERDPKREQMGSAVLAAVAHGPTLLQPAREEIRRRLAGMLRSGLSFERAAVIFFAVQGLTLLELLSLSPLSVKERKDFVGELLRLADEEDRRD